MMNMLKKALVTVMMCLCLSVAAVPAMETQGAVQAQTETQAASEGQAAAQTHHPVCGDLRHVHRVRGDQRCG